MTRDSSREFLVSLGIPADNWLDDLHADFCAAKLAISRIDSAIDDAMRASDAKTMDALARGMVAVVSAPNLEG